MWISIFIQSMLTASCIPMSTLYSHIHVKCVLWHFIVITLFNPKILIVTFCCVTFCPFTQINTIAYSNFSFILGIFTRESYSPEQSIYIILKADVTPSLRVLLKVVFIIISPIQWFKSIVMCFFLYTSVDTEMCCPKGKCGWFLDFLLI